MYEAMATIRRYSCIEWDRRARETDYVRIMNMTTCAAMVGHNAGRNDVFLHEPNCMSVGIIMHELLHIVGFQHEQSRSDRDDYVDVIFDNIVNTGNYRLNFNKHDTANMALYDFNSVMHYPRLSWGKKPYLQTIVPKVMPVPKVGQRVRLSPHDIEEIRSLYQCSESTFDRCGEDFENVEEGTIQSPNYPDQYPRMAHCNWLITAPKDKYVSISFTDFVIKSSWTCEEDALIIHDGEDATAPQLAKLCGDMSEIDDFPSQGCKLEHKLSSCSESVFVGTERNSGTRFATLFLARLFPLRAICTSFSVHLSTNERDLRDLRPNLKPSTIPDRDLRQFSATTLAFRLPTWMKSLSRATLTEITNPFAE